MIKIIKEKKEKEKIIFMTHSLKWECPDCHKQGKINLHPNTVAKLKKNRKNNQIFSLCDKCYNKRKNEIVAIKSKTKPWIILTYSKVRFDGKLNTIPPKTI